MLPQALLQVLGRRLHASHAVSNAVMRSHATSLQAPARPLIIGVSSLSTLAVEEEAVESHKVRTRRKKMNPIVITENAAQRIKELLLGESAKGATGIRLGVRRRGCNGLSYTLNYAFEHILKDEKLETHGLTIYIEPMALFNMVGTVMDFEETELASEFTFKNPNSKGECGCGESFNV